MTRDAAPLRHGSGRFLRHRRGPGAADTRGPSFGLGDVLEGLRAKIGDLEFETRLDLPVGVLGQSRIPPGSQAPSSRAAMFTPPSPIRSPSALTPLRRPSECPRGTQVRRSGGTAGVALDHTVLHLERAAHGIDHAAKLDNDAVTSAA